MEILVQRGTDDYLHVMEQIHGAKGTPTEKFDAINMPACRLSKLRAGLDAWDYDGGTSSPFATSTEVMLGNLDKLCPECRARLVELSATDFDWPYADP
jgi:hypothetical protein